MRIKITDIGWGIDRRTGVRTEKLLEKKYFNAEPNLVMEIGPLKKQFKVVGMEDDHVDIELKEGKVMTFYIGDTFNYYPVSRDGGHYYIIEIKY